MRIANLAGVFRLAPVPIKLLLEIGLGVDGSTERAHLLVAIEALGCWIGVKVSREETSGARRVVA